LPKNQRVIQMVKHIVILALAMCIAIALFVLSALQAERDTCQEMAEWDPYHEYKLHKGMCAVRTDDTGEFVSIGEVKVSFSQPERLHPSPTETPSH